MSESTKGCSYVMCTLGLTVAMDPCHVCGKGVHHICANEVYMGELSTRLCSDECLGRYKASGNDTSDNVASQRNFDSQETTVQLAQSSETSQTIDSHGIPTSVAYIRQNGSATVWNHMRKLKIPIKSARKKTIFTHICILCADDLNAKNSRDPELWRGALFRIPHSSNAWKHMKKIHNTHAVFESKIKGDIRRAEKAIIADEELVASVLGKRTVPDCGEKPICEVSQASSCDRSQTSDVTQHASQTSGGYRRISDHFRLNSRQIGTTIFKWMIRDGRPFNHVTTSAFKDMICSIALNPNLSILSRDRYNDLLDGEFSLFAKSVLKLLRVEKEKACGEPFLNILHDIWTNANNNSVVGVSLAFIDSTWCWRYIAVLATEKPDGHDAFSVSTLIREETTRTYGADIVDMARYIASDTTSSARKVAEYFEEAEQSDCNMHMLNLCIAYGIGLKDNTRTETVYDQETGNKAKVTRYVTSGGLLEEGKDVIGKLRRLSNFFSSDIRMTGLIDTQKASGIPQLKPKIDIEVRVASACDLFRRSMLNRTAYRMYFETHEGGDVFNDIKECDWEFISEMEAVTYYLSELALTEVQREVMLSSYMLVFRKMAEKRLMASSFSVHDYSIPSAHSTERTLTRVPKEVKSFSDAGKRCIARTLAQVRERFPPIDGDSALTLRLDPRTKNCAREIIFGSTGGHIEAIMFQAIANFKEEHFRLSKIASQWSIDDDTDPPRHSDEEVNDSDGDSCDEVSMPYIEDEFLCGAPIPASDQRIVEEAELRVESDSTVDMWMARQEKWVQIAYQQNRGSIRSSKLKKRMRLNRGQSNDGSVKICWNLLGLYQYVDIMDWFREVAAVEFPIIATMSRLRLGKVSSTAFQERVFWTGSQVMNELRAQTDPDRAEKQLLLKQNSKEIEYMGRVL